MDKTVILHGSVHCPFPQHCDEATVVVVGNDGPNPLGNVMRNWALLGMNPAVPTETLIAFLCPALFSASLTEREGNIPVVIPTIMTLASSITFPTSKKVDWTM
jgi:hypothetical protein